MSQYDLANLFSQYVQTQEAEASLVNEPMIGLVTDNKDPDKLGRVRVKIVNLSMDDQTWWIPVVMLGAGKNRGWFFIPEVDDEVIIMFEHGHLDFPIVIGAMWNGLDKPPDANPQPGGNPHRVITSRAGSRVFFDDALYLIIIEDGAGNGRITFDSVANKITIEALKGDVCFQSPTGDTQIVAQTITMKAQQNVEIYAGSTMAWGTDATASIKGKDVTMSGSTANYNCGLAQAPTAPTATPTDVPDPYGS